MELLASENQLQLVVSESAKSLPDLLYSQRELFRSQIDELENIVLTQCKLTGVNPLSQEMAAGALSIKIGKRPRDLLNPKAIKYMQSIFSIKDAISKKETREISALFGVTATQVRDFFNSQRSRVRKFIRLSREKADRSISSKQMQEQQGELPVNIDPNEPLNPVPLDSVAPISIEEAPTCSKEDEALPAIDESDKHFVENIFSLMRKEETFSGQVKLMEWILQIQNSSVLFWFLTKGGIMILATWLSQAVVEEQTSVLNVILKVLCHLPLQKALPVHMSAVLQSVNRLRFYRASDISNRARILLSRWSKAFARSQALKKKNGTKSANDTQDEMLLKQSINEVMGNGSWDSKIDLIEDGSTTLDEISGNIRKLESQPLKLLTASPDDTNKKLISGVRSSQSRERRKVLLVEQPCQKSAGRSSQVGRPTATQGRPLSADDIQKAKMRAQFMQSKYGKTNITSSESSPLQLEAANKSNSPQMSILQSVPKADIGHVIEEPKKSENPPSKISYLQDPSIANKMISNSDEPPQKKCKRVQIPWQTPPEMVLNVSWRVGTGESSKEVEVQKHRIHRERETIYKAVQEIPSDPREPWDREMDYDDSLTPEIPTDQLPDADGGAAEASTCTRENEGTTTASTSSQQINGGNQPEPDMELLAVLLKNPELVFALTSGHAGNLSSEETVKLLDMIKANGIGLSSSASTSSSGSLSVLGANGKAEEKVEVSLPSPTPSCNPVTNGWKADLARNPFSREAMMNNHEMDAAAAAHYQQNIAATSLMQQPLHVRPTGTLAALAVAEHSASSVLHSQPQILPTAIPSHSQSVLGLHQNAHAAYAAFPMQASELELKTRTNLAVPAIMQVEATGIVNPSRSSYATESSSRPTRQIPHYQQNNFNSFAGGGQYMRGGRGGGWERNELLGDEQDFESWSPPPHGSHSNSRYNNNSISQQGWNYPESTSTSSRVNHSSSSSYSYDRSRNPSGYHPNHPPSKSGGGIKRWNH